MRLEQVVGDESVSLPGFERRTFRCSSCGESEQRLTFSSAKDPSQDQAAAARAPSSGHERLTTTDEQSASGDIEQRLTFRSGKDPGEDQRAAALAPSSGHEHPTTTHEQPAITHEQSATTKEQARRTAGRLEPVIETLSGIYIRVKGLLRFGRENNARSQCPAPIDARVPRSATDLTPAEPGPSTAPTWPNGGESGLALAQQNNSLDECQALLYRAIEMVHGPARRADNETVRDLARENGLIRGPTTDMVCEPASTTLQSAVGPNLAPRESIASAREPEAITRKPLVVAIKYDPHKTKYAAKNVSTGLLILRHEDKARLKGMCDRMGWQVVDDIE